MARLLLLASLALMTSATPCYDRCRFKFCDERTTYSLETAPFMPFTGALCNDMGERVVQVQDNMPCQAMIYEGGTFAEISSWSPPGLNVKFSSSFFKIMRTGFSSLVHGPLVGDQRTVLNGKCVVIPLDAWRLLDKHNVLRDNIYTRHNNLEDCVAFLVVKNEYGL